MTVGTAPGNQLVLSDPEVSGHHCTLTVTPAGIELSDLDSTNGTLIAGCRVQTALLARGAPITIGATLFRADVLEETLCEPLSRSDRFGPVLGRSMAMRRLFAIVERVAPSEASILIEGETGTGKGLLAEAIHQASSRAHGPFITIDCAAIPPTLMEVELFGHEQGAFTGAHSARAGLFEAAAGGTVFLDEIGELPRELQPKLLRAIEKHEVRRVGSAVAQKLDVRVIAATHRDLRRQVNQGEFREDLYYRLKTVRLVLPPLRDRPEDIPLLVQHFYRNASPDSDRDPPPELLAAMRKVPWRGNVRELASTVERYVIFGGKDPMTSSDGDRDPNAFDPDLSYREAKTLAMETWEVGYVRKLLARYDGNLARAARGVRMDRSHLRDLLHRYGLKAR
jgi:DNA-binding NtrC family response regulator